MRQAFLSRGADFSSAQGPDALTPLQFAERYGHTACAEVLRRAAARRRWRPLLVWAGLVVWLQKRAAKRVYAPGGAGFEQALRRGVASGMAP